jgi:hypothetical protein
LPLVSLGVAAPPSKLDSASAAHPRGVRHQQVHQSGKDKGERMKIGEGVRLLGVLFLAGAIGGCASIVSGGSQQVTFNSSPDGATVTVNGLAIGKTPITTSLKRKSDQTLIFAKDSYRPITMQLETKLNGWFWGNILCCGLVGSTTDNYSGAMNEYSPSQYMVTLQPEGTGPMETKTAINSRQKAKDYIVIAYRNILGDLGKGEGEYLSSLFAVLNIPEADRVEAAKKIRALSEVYSIIPDFADHVVDLYIKT